MRLCIERLVPTMTKTLLRVLNGEAISPPPVWLMRQAGRYLPEYRALRSKASDFITLCTTPALAAEITLQPVRRFGMDAAILFSDLPLLPWALGQKLEYREGEGPVLPPIRDAAGLSRLDASRAGAKLAPIMETVQRVRASVGDAALIGFAGSPFTVACYMVEGRGSKDFFQTRLFAYTNPALFRELLDVVAGATIEFLSAQIEAGAEAVMLFDSWAGLLAPSLFRKHVILPTTRIVAALRERHPDACVIGFPRLAGTLIGDYARRTGVHAVGMDTSADPAVTMGQVPTRVALQGNLDPAVLVAGGPALRVEARDIVKALHGRPHIFNLGHGIVPETPPEHVAQLVQAVRSA
jgi:uroporphyrinogen decarboxylase